MRLQAGLRPAVDNRWCPVGGGLAQQIRSRRRIPLSGRTFFTGPQALAFQVVNQEMEVIRW